MSTLKELKKELKEKGAKKEDIKMALRALICLEGIDRLVFPENPATINFSIGKYRLGFFAAHRLPSEQTEARYNIYINGLAKSLREEKKEGLWIPNVSKNQFRPMRPTWEELLVYVAAHEVRHRVQHDCSLKRFSPKSANLVKDELLKSTIKFNELVFKESKNVYIKDNRSKAYIKGRINRKEFDAIAIERLIAAKIHRKNIKNLLEEIVSTIKMQAP